MSSSSSSSSLLSTPQLIYDVFLSFRGEDTRRTFVAHLHDSLSKAGINAYIDNRLQKGTELGPKLLEAIDGSRISIIVFSKNFHTSTWCLKELEHIMKCRKDYGQVVVPVFYYVDPSVLRYQTGDFGNVLEETATKSFSGGGRRYSVLSTWKIALTQVANLSGWHITPFGRPEVELISKIVEDIKIKRNKRLLNITDFPVGLGTRVHKVIQFIENQSSKVCSIGIWGMGGLGKTTTARAIFNKIQCKFVDHSFVEKVREVCKSDVGDKGLIHLQEQVLANVLKTNEKIDDTASGITKIKDAFIGKKVLIVLDDVSTFEQIDALCGNPKCFVPGSILIVTSRDVRILKLLKVDRIFRIKKMDKKKSLELFSWHAFGEPRPKRDFDDLFLESIVNYCGGLPLALEVIGSRFRDRPKQECERILTKLKRIPDYEVRKKLEISYDGLGEDHEKHIFLDICCFFIGKNRAHVSKILDGCELYAGAGIPILIERGLLKVEKNNKLGMHDLLRDVGREIARKEHGNLRRLFQEDALKILTNNTGKETVEGLVLKRQSTNNFDINATFKDMKNLRLLQLDHVGLTDFGGLSQELRWLHWQGFTDNYIPDDFYLGKLVVFELERSSIIQVWNETKLMKNLKILNLNHSKHLTSSPDFSKLPNLEKLIMKHCSSLSELHHSIGDLKNILLINLKNCTSLRNLPKEVYQLKSLKTLILSGCSKIDRLDKDIVQMESLTTLTITGTSVKEVPYSVVRLNNIGYISLCGYEGLSHDVFRSVIWSWMLNTFPCNNLDFLTSIISSLQQLRTVWIQCHPENQLTQALKIFFDGQYGINCIESETLQIPDFPLRSHLIEMGSWCTVMDILDKSILQGLTSNCWSNFFLPVANHSSWLACIGEGPSAEFQVPKNINCHMEGIFLRVVYSSTSENMGDECFAGVLIINCTKCTIHVYKRDTITSFNGEDWKNVTSNLGPGDDVKIYVAFKHGLIVKKTIVYLISAQSIVVKVDDPNMEMEPSPKPNKSLFTRLPDRMGACLCLYEHTNIGLGACICLNHNTD